MEPLTLALFTLSVFMSGYLAMQLTRERRRARRLADRKEVMAINSRLRQALDEVTERERIITAQADRLRDLYTTLTHAHEQLQATQRQVIEQERQRALGQMASGIAHDFNNALAPIVGFSELLLAVPGALDDREKVHTYLDLIHTSAHDAAGVVRRLREFYRPRDEKEVLGLVELPALIQETIALTQPKWKDQAQAQGRTVHVVTRLDAVPPVSGDATALREALANMVFNAVDAMPQGGTITMRAYVDEGRRTKDEFAGVGGDSSSVFRPSSRSGMGAVVVEVADTGTGMSEEVRRRCLDPFFSTKGERGTGLGLAMVHGIMGRHDGTLELESALGRGTTVRLCFPLPSAVDDAGDRSSQVAAPSGEAAWPSGLRLLVVDDDVAVRAATVVLLSMDQHVVTEAGSGAEALEVFRDGPFDAVVTDRAMPGMNGEQLAALLKQAAPQVPVLLLTGFGDLMEATGETAASLGGVDQVLSKPTSLAALRAALQEVCHTRPTQPEALAVSAR